MNHNLGTGLYTYYIHKYPKEKQFLHIVETSCEKGVLSVSYDMQCLIVLNLLQMQQIIILIITVDYQIKQRAIPLLKKVQGNISFVQ